mmetsp:Transcript_18423/g.53802  ORF Transcript_18423/g.53802 Transcript_18423/m.53802 type:complete len:245 (+) Transcript_18423:630-1364(+)
MLHRCTLGPDRVANFFAWAAMFFGPMLKRLAAQGLGMADVSQTGHEHSHCWVRDWIKWGGRGGARGKKGLVRGKNEESAEWQARVADFNKYWDFEREASAHAPGADAPMMKQFFCMYYDNCDNWAEISSEQSEEEGKTIEWASLPDGSVDPTCFLAQWRKADMVTPELIDAIANAVKPSMTPSGGRDYNAIKAGPVPRAAPISFASGKHKPRRVEDLLQFARASTSICPLEPARNDAEGDAYLW